MERSRRGITLIELMVVVLISGVLLAALVGWVPRQVESVWLSKGAAGVQAEVVAARSAAAATFDAYRPQKVVGVRLLPDPSWPLAVRADGTIDPAAPIGYARTVPLVEAAPYRTGYVAIHADGFPAGFTPAWRRLVLEESPAGPDGLRCEPTNWCWQVRVGDVVTVLGRPYTVCGPTAVPIGPGNAEGYVNVGPPGSASGLDRGAGPVEYLYLTDRVDDDGDGYADSGWDGLDEDLDGLIDEDDEWEVERWTNVPPGGVAAVPYAIKRRPIALDAREGGDVADLKKTPSPVVVDGRKSVLPVNPYTGAVDVAFDETGAVATPTIHGRPFAPPLGVNKLLFWVAPRADVAGTPEPDASHALVGLDLRTGKIAVDDEGGE